MESWGTLSKKLLLLINKVKKHWTAENKERQNVHAKILPFKATNQVVKQIIMPIINIILKLMLFYDPKGETNKQTNIKRHF